MAARAPATRPNRAGARERQAISDSVFRNIDGAAIENYDCTDAAAWCDNTFESLSAPPLICQGNPAECP